MQAFLSALIVTVLIAILVEVNSKISIRDHPYQLELLKNNDHWCSGVLISTKTVLSVARCTYGIPKQNLTIIPGSTIAGNRYVRQYQILYIRNHKKFTPSTEGYDISVIFPKLEIQTDGKFVTPIFLVGMVYLPGTEVTVSGWKLRRGKRSSHFAFTSKELKLKGSKTCSSYYKNFNITVSKEDICAYKRDSAVCTGEPGAPLVIQNKLVGLVSQIYYPLCKHNPGIYTTIFHHKEFIKKVVRKVLEFKKF